MIVTLGLPWQWIWGHILISLACLWVWDGISICTDTTDFNKGKKNVAYY